MRFRARIGAQSETRWSAPLAALNANSQVVRYLARALLAAEPNVDALTAKAQATLGRKWRWLRPLANRYEARFEGLTRPRLREVTSFLLEDEGLQRAAKRHGAKLLVAQRIAGSQHMQPVDAAAAWGVPAIESVAELAVWLRLDESELAWFADLKNRGRQAGAPEPLRHYHYRIFQKRSGSVRLIESPKERMKTLQRQMLSEILNRIPAHEAAHGFVRGRSIRTFAELHTKRDVVLRMDLKDFFPSVRRARVQSVFRTLGYPEPVADLLGGIATTCTPRSVFRSVPPEDRAELRALYEQSHLPQGAPTSPALANACCYRLDCRLAGLAKAAGAAYTRYADDLAFSGDGAFARNVERFADHVGAIVLEEGLAVNFRKTRVMRQSAQQHLAGLVVNERVNIKRAEYDRLKAILTNCARNGPEAENRDGRQDFQAHLAGRVEFIRSIHPAYGARLSNLFAQIEWP